MIKPELKTVIEQDIEICQRCLDEQSSESQALYDKMVAKYKMIDKNFCEGIPQYIKLIDSPYYSEISVIIEKLKMYLIIDDIPIQYNENVAQNALIINGDKNKFKGNIGQGNFSKKQTDISPNFAVEKKGLCSLIKKLFGGK